MPEENLFLPTISTTNAQANAATRTDESGILFFAEYPVEIEIVFEHLLCPGDKGSQGTSLEEGIEKVTSSKPFIGIAASGKTN